jgi:predicted RNA-binding Zn ribbon-like protein
MPLSSFCGENHERNEVKEEATLSPAMFIGGALPLDFLNSIATPVDEIVDWIGNGADFLSWMKQAGLLTDDDIKTIKQSMSTPQLDAAAKEARALRDWFRRFVHEHRGHPLKRRAADQLGPLNEILDSDAVFWQIETSNHKSEGSSPTIFHLRPQRRWRKPDSLLSPLVEEMAKFICSADFRYVKACEGGKCTLLFLDLSHRHGRRWCSMAICGNRAKSAAFAARSKSPKGKQSK